MKLFLPENVKIILETLRKNGYKGYVVGGCVRDCLMDKPPHDYDITTDALPETVEALFEKTIPTGIKHGTVTVLSDGEPIEVTTFRTEGGYTDSRRPDTVNFVTDVKDDLARRDFTVNAIAYNEQDGLIDPFGGVEDIKAKVLRAVGVAETRFEEDALRILRLFRFASQLDFTAEEQTLNAALRLSGGLQKISRERIAVELKKAVCGTEPAALMPLLDCGALEFIGISAPKTLSPLKILPTHENIRLAAFITLCGADSAALSKELKLSCKQQQYLLAISLLNDAPPDISAAAIKQAMRRHGKTATAEHLVIREALEGVSLAEAVDTIEQIRLKNEPYKISMLAIGGAELTALGIQGKRVGELLDALLDAVIADPTLNTRENLLEIAARLS